ncbi:MAG: lysophospholipid acyltransferase family protein [Hyphomicrobiales bacterium]|nr:lysophospholipid acyltransferase family protein [Hyphomicrobiales bacterium]MDE2017908.1 lysophospholipid acyltransferase family protein [Hyphomicrobiales bacterium]
MDTLLFSYAEPTDPPLRRLAIRVIELFTGQPTLKRLYVEYQRAPRPDESFFVAALRKLGINMRLEEPDVYRIPRSGPLVVVANHPFGVLDGLAISAIVERARPDFLVLTNAVLLRAPEARAHLLAVDFSGQPGAQETNLQTREAARRHLAGGGCVVVFPAGGVSTARDRLGLKPAIDARWGPFVAQLVRRAKADVLPIWFGGQNSRLFQVASHVSLTLRLSLVFHEVKRRIGTALEVAVGEAIPFASLAGSPDLQAIADGLMRATYGLAPPSRRRARQLAELDDLLSDQPRPR